MPKTDHELKRGHVGITYCSDTDVQNPLLSSVKVLRVEAAVKNKGGLYRAEILLGSRLSPTTPQVCLRSQEVLNHIPMTATLPPPALPGKRHPRAVLQICPLPSVPLSFLHGASVQVLPALLTAWARLLLLGSQPVLTEASAAQRWALTAAKLTLWRVSECLRKVSSRLLSPVSHSKGSDVLGSCKSLYPR